jgi:hypothetical protein
MLDQKGLGMHERRAQRHFEWGPNECASDKKKKELVS